MPNTALKLDSLDNLDTAQPPAVNTVTVGELGEHERAAWDHYARHHDRGTIYHRCVWKNIVASEFAHDTHYLVAKRADDIVGILPMVRIKSALFGDYVVSMPFLNYGGALGDDATVENALMLEAAALCERLGVSHAEFRDDAPRDNWPSRTDKVSMLLPLPREADDLWKDIGKKRRSDVKRSAKRGATVRRGREELLDDFYDVFAHNMRDLGTPVYARSFFKTMLEHLPAQSYIVAAYMDERAVAAGFLIRDGSRLEIPWASALREYNRFSVNTLLYWEVLKDAIESGAEMFDFGRSSVDGGTYAFKKRWGATEHQLHWHYWLSEGKDMPNLTPNNPKYQLAINVWRRLPVPITRILGPHLVRNLP